MAASAWMHGAAAMRLTEGLVSVLKEQRPEFLSEALENYREHGVFSSQVTGAASVGPAAPAFVARQLETDRWKSCVFLPFVVSSSGLRGRRGARGVQQRQTELQ